MATNDSNPVFVSSKIQNLVSAWEQSSVTQLVSIELIDNGLPYLLTGGPLTGDGLNQILVASDFTNPSTPLRNLLPLRNEKGADVVILITSSIPLSSCGKAPTFWWNREYNPLPVFWPTPIVDLRGQEDSYIALISSAPECNDPYLVTHEFGHLFGGGHELGTSTDGYYLFGNSHAALRLLPPEPGVDPVYTKTALARDKSQIGVCANSICLSQNVYSDGSGGQFGNSDTNNVLAINTVAFSVATYRETENNCQLAKPNNLVGFPTHICYGYDPVATRHFTFWEDSCPDQTDFYDVYYSWLSPSGPYVYGWTTPYQYTSVVTTRLAFIKTEACNSSVCSGKSNSYYAAAFLCLLQ